MRKPFSHRSLSICAIVLGTLALFGVSAIAADPAQSKAADAVPAETAAPAPAKDAIPVFSLKMLDGKTVSNDTVKGKPSVFVFWQTACSLCRVEVEDINQLAQMQAYKGINIYLVNVDLNAAKVLPSYVETNKISLPILVDPDYTLGPKFGINSTPGAAFVNSKGKVVSTTKGYGGDGISSLKAGLDAIK
jgi:peroxiredoxin